MALERVRNIVNEPLYQVAFFVFLFQAIFAPSYSLEFDRYCFHSWCNYIFEHGLSQAYHNSNPEFNYPPLISYPLFLFGKLAGNQINIDRYFRLFKAFPLLFDFIAAVLIARFSDNHKRQILFLLLLIANPIFLYNSYCWGQYDAVLSTLVFISFLFILKEKLIWGILFFVLAINFKVQAIIFAPPLLMLSFYKFWGKLHLLDVLRATSAAVVLQVIIVLPFLLTGEITGVVKAVIGSVDFYPVVSFNAYNVWYFLLGEQAFHLSDKTEWYGVSYKYWGLIMFCCFSFFTLLPLFTSAVSTFLSKRKIQSDRNTLLITFALIPLLFFYFNTQMHERYPHPAFVFIALFAFTNRKFFLFGIMCLAYLGNLEIFLRNFGFPNYEILIFHPAFVSSLYLLLIISLFYYLYLPFTSELKKYTNE